MKTILLILAALPAFGQNTVAYIATTGKVSLSSAGTAATIQQPTDGTGTQVFFPRSTQGGAPPVGASIQCSVACVVTISRNGTAATGTASNSTTNVNPVNPNMPAASFRFFTASNAGGGTTLRVFNVPAGGEYPLDLSDLTLPNTNLGTTNITISVASLTGDVNITFKPMENH